MGAILESISNNGLVSALAATALIAIVTGAWKRWRNHKDSKAIYNYLLSSKSTTDWNFRSTEAISSHTKIPEDRVAQLCSKHPKIRRNEKEKQSWMLIE